MNNKNELAYSRLPGLFAIGAFLMVFSTVLAGAISVSPQSLAIDTGQSFTLSANASGLSSYQWYNISSGSAVAIPGATSATLSQTAGSPGSFQYEVQATSVNGTVSGSATLSVNPSPSVSLSSGSATLDQGQEYTAFAYYSPGTGSPSYLWNTGGLTANSGCGYPSDSSCTINTAGASTGTYTVSVSLKDSSLTPYLSAPAAASIKINPAPTVSITPSAGYIAAEQLETYTISISGGTGPFLISLLDASGSVVGTAYTAKSGPTATISFAVPNTTTTQSFRASVTDSGASQAYNFYSAWSTISVSGPVQAPAPSTFSARRAIVFSVVGVFAIIIALAYYVSWNRKDTQPKRQGSRRS